MAFGGGEAGGNDLAIGILQTKDCDSAGKKSESRLRRNNHSTAGLIDDEMQRFLFQVTLPLGARPRANHEMVKVKLERLGFLM